MAIQREIDKRTGLKGRASKFMFPVSESKFSGDRVMFNDTGSIRLDYSLDNKKSIAKRIPSILDLKKQFKIKYKKKFRENLLKTIKYYEK